MMGFLNINKPEGYTSFDIVAIVRKKIGVKKVGHLGTLDPMATGVLPVAIGKATKLFDYFLNKEKTYIATFLVGTETDTLDITGKILKEENFNITQEKIDKILPNFIGEIIQIPPKYSAKKIAGKRAYKLAKSDFDFEMKPNKVKICSISTIKPLRDSLITFKIRCCAGVYIRSLGRDIFNALGTCATMTKLERIDSGIFKIEDSLSVEELDGLDCKKIVPVEKVLGDMHEIKIPAELKTRFLNGVKLERRRFDDSDFVFKNLNEKLNISSCTKDIVPKNENILISVDSQIYGIGFFDNEDVLKVKVNLYEGENNG